MRRGKEEDEVEQLLQAAQDEMILELSVNSHTARSSSDNLDPDLHSRFLALKSQPSAKKKKDQQQREKPRPRSPTKLKDVEATPEDLMRRFKNLKTSFPSASSSSSPPLPDTVGEDSDEVGEDAEVEKLIQWAIDAARLDPSPPSDDDHNQSSDDDDEENGSRRNVKL